MKLLFIILIIIAVLWIGLGTVIALFATSAGGEKFVLDMNTIKFIFLWPFYFLMMSGR